MAPSMLNALECIQLTGPIISYMHELKKLITRYATRVKSYKSLTKNKIKTKRYFASDRLIVYTRLMFLERYDSRNGKRVSQVYEND